MKKILTGAVLFLALFFSPSAVRASCGSAVPNIFINGVSTVDATTMNANNTFLVACANNVDNTQIGAAGIYASQVIPSNATNATFGGSQIYKFPNGITVPTGFSVAGDVINKVYNVKTYGAVGDGSTDDTTAIQNAINAAVAGGVGGAGIVYFPPGSYKVTSTITIVNTGATGILVEGAGTGAYTPNGGSTIKVAFASGDVFKMPGAGGGTGDPMFTHLNVDAGTVTRTSGATFDYVLPSGGQLDHVYTNRDYDAVAFGTPGVDSQNMIDIHDSEFFQVRHYVFHQTGDTNGGGAYIHDILAYGNSTEYGAPSGTGTNYCYFAENGAVVDPLYWHNVDCEGLANGFYFDVSSGYMADFFMTNSIFDGVRNGNDIRLRTTGTGNIVNGHITNVWATASTSSDAVLLSANHLQSSSTGVHVVTINGLYASSSGGNCLNLSQGTADITVQQSFLTGCTSNSGISVGGDATTSDIDTILLGNRLGSGVGGVSIGISLAGANRTVISGNDFSGSTTAISSAGESAAAATTNTIITGNLFTVGLSFPGPYATTQINGNLGSGNITPIMLSNSGVSLTTGSGAPAGACTSGSLYTNTAGGSGTTLYGCYGSAWHAATSP